MVRRILILGAGAGGTIVANKLARDLRREIAKGEVEVTVLDKDNRNVNPAGFTFLPFGFYTQLDIVRARSSLLSPRVKFLYGENGECRRVDLKSRSVVVSSRKQYNYDYLVIATGAVLDVASVPGLAKDLNTFYTYDGALKLRDVIAGFKGGRIVIHTVKMPISCPGAPGKFAVLLDDYLRYVKGEEVRKNTDIQFLWPGDAIGPPSYNANLTANFERREINLTRKFITVEVDRKNKEVVSTQGERVKYDLLVSIPPHKGALIGSGISDENGWVPADKYTLQYKSGSEHYDDVYVIGDAGPPDRLKMGITTHFQSLYAAQNLINDVMGTGVKQLYRGETGCPYLESSYTSYSAGRAYMAAWTYNKPLSKFKATELGWLLYRMYYYLYFDMTLKGLL